MTPPLDTARDDESLAYGRALEAWRDDPLVYYHPEDAELLQYGAADWSGPHEGPRGGSYWVSTTGNHRRVYSTENPGGRGDAHKKRLEEGRQQRAEAKATGKQHAAGQKQWEQHFKGKQAQEDAAEKASRPAKHAAAAHQLVGDMMGRVKAGEAIGTQEAVGFSQQLLGHLQEMTVKDIQGLKQQHGLKASGVKAQLALKVASAALRPEQAPRAGPSRVAAPATAPWEGGQVEPGKVYNAPTGSLQVDPTRFQFKLNTNEAGVTDELKDVKTFNPDFAGVVSVWQDPANGKTYVVNGHHRHELAERTGHPDLAVRYVEAATAKEARAIGALVNIAEGRGTAIDATKFMRDMGVDPAGLEKYGVSLKGKLAQDATSLVNLNDRQFDRLARGLLVPEKALAVAKHLKNPELQDQLFRLLEQREDSGKDLSPKVIEEMAIKMASTPTTSTTEKTLFGDITSEESLFVPIAEVQAHVRSALGKEVNDFLAVANARRAGRVAGAGNVLNIEENRRIATEAARVQHVYEKLVNRKGPIADAINEAGASYAAAKSKGERDAIRKQAVERVRDAVFAEAGVGSGADGGGATQPGGVAAGGTGGEPPGAGQPAAPAAADGGTAAADGGGAAEQPTGVIPQAPAAKQQPAATPPPAPAPSPAAPEKGAPATGAPARKTAADLADKVPRVTGNMPAETANRVIAAAEEAARTLSTPEFEKFAQTIGIAALAGKTKGEKLQSLKDSVNRLAVSTQTTNDVMRRGAAATPPPTPSPHASTLAALPVGDLQRVGGFPVRRVGPNDYRIETQTAQKGTNQTQAEKEAGYIKGDAKKIAAYIETQTKQDAMHGRARTEALARVKDFAEPSFMDQAGQQRAQAGFAALPEGATVVSLDENTHGRTGKIVRDSQGKNRVQLDGEDGFASGYVEPLDSRQSWRVPQQKEEGPKQAGMFGEPSQSASISEKKQESGQTGLTKPPQAATNTPVVEKPSTGAKDMTELEQTYSEKADESGVKPGAGNGRPAPSRFTFAQIVAGKKPTDPKQASAQARTGLWNALWGGLPAGYAAEELVRGGFSRESVAAAAQRVVASLADSEDFTPDRNAAHRAALAKWQGGV